MFAPDYELSAAERMVIAVDTKDVSKAVRLASIAKNSGAVVIKEGLELLMATSPKVCSEIAETSGLDWIADFKLKDIPNTVAGAVESIVALDHPPIGITVHTKSGVRALQEAQRIADERGITIFGVTHLTSIDEAETKEYEKTTPKLVVWRESRRAVAGKAGGLVCAAPEVSMIKRFKKTKDLYTLVPGTRSIGADIHDQKRPLTPEEAILAGADLLVIGRQVTGAEEPVFAFDKVAQEIDQALRQRFGLEEAV